MSELMNVLATTLCQFLTGLTSSLVPPPLPGGDLYKQSAYQYGTCAPVSRRYREKLLHITRYSVADKLCIRLIKTYLDNHNYYFFSI